MKKIYILLLVALIWTMHSCQDILEVDPVSTLAYGNFWGSEESARVAMIGLHSTMRDNHMDFHFLGEIRSDLYGGVGFESPNDVELIFQDIRIDNAPFINWAGFYTDLHRINDAIKYIPQISFANENEKNYFLGQVYGMRAFYYYVMLRTWGGVPLVTEPTETIDFSNLQKPRASEQEVMTLIKSDLEASLDAFGDQNQFYRDSRNFWSKAASLVLKGDVYIWSGTHLNGGNSDYQTAKAALTEVVAMDQLSLLPDFESIFRYDNKNNSEIIFAFHFEINQATNGMGLWHGRQTEISALFDAHGNIMGHTLALSGANRYHPSDEYLQVLFEDPLDQRGEATLIRLFRTPDADPSQYAGSLGNKFMGTISGGSRSMVDDIPVYRYAYAILLLAEAKNLLGEDPSPEINLIRQRAYGTNYSPAIHGYSNQTMELNTEAILEEELKEFGLEGKRWWDLRRAGDEYVIKHNKYLEPGDEYKLVLPITREMIGRDPSLLQTPGYGT